jgi:hypothetical protein
VIGLSAEVRPFHKGYQHFTVTAKAPISITDTHDPLALSKEFMEAFSLLSEEFSRNFYEVGAIGAKALLSATTLGSLLEARLGSQHVNYRESHDNFS